MNNLIGFNLKPEFDGRDMLSRESLLSDLVSRGVLSCATQEVKDLYHLLEHKFHPLDIGSKIKPLLDRISKLGGKLSSASSLPEVQLSQYVPYLEMNATLKLLQQVSKTYQTIRIRNLAQLIPFFDFSAVETISVDAVRNNFVDMKVDHIKGVVVFGNLCIESEGLKYPLAIFAETMNKVRAMLFPAPMKALKLDDTVPNLRETVEKERNRVLARKSIIEKRKEEQERQLLEMEREEEQRRLKLLKLAEEVEQKRLATELEERRKQRIFREIEERELEEAQALLEDTERCQKKGKKKTLLDGREAELSKERHDIDLIGKNRLARMLDNKEIFQERVISLRQAEFDRLRTEKEERISQITRARKQERDTKRKRIYHLKSEEERIMKLHEEEEARKREEADKRRKEETLLKPTDALTARSAEPPESLPAKYVLLGLGKGKSLKSQV